jgi:hypothetical protein
MREVGGRVGGRPPLLCSELVEHHLRVSQVGGVEAFSEPAVDVGMHSVRFVAAG